jgi:1,4-dihydroxy-2-naphthoate polyprenyltransferase
MACDFILTPNFVTMVNAKAWIGAIRPRTLPLAASSIIVGAAMAVQAHEQSTEITIFALITTLLLQILSNLANDYGDFSHGVDNEDRVGPKRALQSGAISKGAMARAIIITSAGALVSGLWLLWISFGQMGQFKMALGFLILGIAAIASAIKYTSGKNPYGYKGLGDLFVFIFFGIVGVTGSFYLHTHCVELKDLLPAVTVGLLSTAVLNLNNLRDHINDAASGKRTMVVKMGFKNGKVYHTTLLAVSLLSIVLWLFATGASWFAWMPLSIYIILLAHVRKVWVTSNPAELDPQLKVVALSTFVFSILLLISQVI